jgi:signal transduction histidine kinase
MTTDRRPSSLALIRRLVDSDRDRPFPEMMHDALESLAEGLDLRAAFVARVEEGVHEIADAVWTMPPPLARGSAMALQHTFMGAVDPPGGVINVRDASKSDPFRRLPMQRDYQVTSYLGVPIHSGSDTPWGTLAVLGKGPRIFRVADTELLQVVAGLLAARLHHAGGGSRRSPVGRSPISMLRLASHEVEEPLAILRGYADMLARDEIPLQELPLVARRLQTQSETVIRTVDQVLILARLPLELAFTVRVSLIAVARATTDRLRPHVEQQGMELRLQLDAQGEVWGDPTLLGAALDEMVYNVFKHAPTATVIQVRLREAAKNRLQLMVKDDGPGISADRLAQLFGPLDPQTDPPSRGQGVGLYLLRRVADAHGGSAWANSLEGKGTTFYLELPAASPDGEAVRASSESQQSSA